MFLPFTGLSTSQIVQDLEVNSVFVDFAFETTQHIRIYIYTQAAYFQYLVIYIHYIIYTYIYLGDIHMYL